MTPPVEKDYIAAENFRLPNDVGRPTQVVPNMKSLFPMKEDICHVCSKDFHVGNCLSHSTNICEACLTKNPISTKKIVDLDDKKRGASPNSCFTCNGEVNGAVHALGAFMFCSKCIRLKKCLCATCSANTSMQMKIQSDAFNISNGNDGALLRVVAGKECGTKTQLEKFMACKTFPNGICELLATYHPRGMNPYRTCIRHHHLTVDYDTMSKFGIMKKYGKEHPTYKWMPATKDRRQMSKKIMEYAGLLLLDSNTLSLGPLKGLEEFREVFDTVMIACRELPMGVFTFRFITFFNERNQKNDESQWDSYIIDFNDEDRDVWYFAKNNHFAKKVVHVCNKAFQMEWEFLKKK